MKMRKNLVASWILLFTSPALAQAAGRPTSNAPATSASDASEDAAAPAEPDPTTVHQHAGVYLRMHLGGGYRSMSASAGSSMKITGAGASFGLAIGGPVAENLILLGELMVEAAQNPTIEMGSQSVSSQDASFTFVGLGPGVTYYIMPANVHVGASVLLTDVTLSYKGQKIAETNWGFGGVVRVGKDFWIGKRFGLGGVAQFSLASMKDKANDVGPTPTWTTTAASLALEGTFN